MTVPRFPEFKPIGLEDREVCEGLLRRLQPEISELTFTNLFIWRHYYDFRLARHGQSLLVLAAARKFFLPPLGPAEPAIIEDCLGYLQEDGRIERVPETDAFGYAGQLGLTCEPQPDQSDYLYSVSDLIELSGRRFHRKRQHLNQFLRLYGWHYSPLSGDLVHCCLELEEKWCDIKGCQLSPGLRAEEVAIREALLNREHLGWRGGAITIGGKVEAFTLGEPLNRNTVVIHAEKANPALAGIYQAINQQFLANEWSNFEFVNREQDLGDEGLRRAKLSYNPLRKVKKYLLRRPA